MKKTNNGAKKLNLYYIGDLPPYRTDGITVSFEYNLKILSGNCKIINVPEKRKLNQTKFGRIIATIKLWFLTYQAFRIKKPDVLYLNYPLTFLGTIKIFVILLMAKDKDAKRVLHIHRGDFYSGYLSKKLNRWFSKIILALADRVIVLSELERRKLSDLYKTDKFLLLHNTIENEGGIRREPSKNVSFVYISNYLESKGIFDLLDVFSELSASGPDLKLECYGAFPNQDIKNKLMTYQSNNVSINESIYGKEKYEVLNKSSCLILPSRSEGQPLILLEAMSCGVPVISSRVGFVQEMLGENYPYLFEANSLEDLARTIKSFLIATSNYKIAQDLQRRYRSHYSRSNHRKRLLKIFDFNTV